MAALFLCAGTESVLSTLFHEELGYVLEVKSSDLDRVKSVLEAYDIVFQHIGQSTQAKVKLQYGHV